MDKQNLNRLTDTESGLAVARGEGCWEQGEDGAGIKKCRLVVTEPPGDGQYGAGDTVRGIVTAACGAAWALEMPGGPLCGARRDCLTTVLHT